MKRCAQCHRKLGLGVRSRNLWNGRWRVHTRFCSEDPRAFRRTCIRTGYPPNCIFERAKGTLTALTNVPTAVLGNSQNPKAMIQ